MGIIKKSGDSSSKKSGSKKTGRHGRQVSQAELSKMLKQAMKEEGLKFRPDKKAQAKALDKIKRGIKGGRKPGRIIGGEDDDWRGDRGKFD